MENMVRILCGFWCSLWGCPSLIAEMIEAISSARPNERQDGLSWRRAAVAPAGWARAVVAPPWERPDTGLGTVSDRRQRHWRAVLMGHPLVGLMSVAVSCASNPSCLALAISTDPRWGAGFAIHC